MMGGGLTETGEGGEWKWFRHNIQGFLRKYSIYKVDGEFKCGSRRLAEEELHKGRDLFSELLACSQNP